MCGARWLCLVLAACGDTAATRDAGVVVDAAPDADTQRPPTLAGTGLCTDAACTTFSADVFEYAPKFELWADTATKRRWIYLPPGAQIDTSDMDYWKFPVGTKLWKEFTRDGVRVETRYIVKLLANDDEAGAWHYVAYQWNTAQNATTLVDIGGAMNANGTSHDIPSRQNCRDCHDEVAGKVLGFGAISLDFNSAKLDLEDLIAQGKLSAPPTTGTAGARFPIPGAATERAALGYLHANCGHCHNPTANNFNHTPTDMRLRVGALAAAAATPAYTTLVNKPSSLGYIHDDGMAYTLLVDGGNANNSILIKRLTSTNATKHMPQRGSELVDPDAMTTLSTWIDALP
ncbi:MAG TPA: hypothetical protein VK427_24435 [Kofleriaceae bacterium]|nr:hypothetical protein [Kofleriaceae bacterium]